ncbi:MAG: alkaline phosphatase PafA [Bacteroidota bacterium]
MLKKLGFAVLILLHTGLTVKSQNRPKLVVGIVVDQMRYDYLYRFSQRYSEGGFKRMMREGFTCHNAHYNYIPTYTAPGHATIYTGTTPDVHGIIANDWYSRAEQKMVYCAEDTTYVTLGSETGAGEMSPSRLLCGTLGDAMKLFSQGQSKVYGVALKDRGSILPAGHNADGAFWYEGGRVGKWISSTYYFPDLPNWVNRYNQSNYPKKLMSQDWNTLYPLTTYSSSGPDNNAFEGKFKGEEKPVFPHEIKNLAVFNNEYDILKYTPFGNTLTTDFAKQLLVNENLGMDEIPDLLAISYSSTDYIGHKFGSNSVEIEDTYLRLDQELASLFSFFDEKVGKGEWVVFLTADHAGTEPPSFLSSKRIPGGYFSGDSLEAAVKDYVQKTFNATGVIENISNEQIFFNPDSLDACQMGEDEIEQISEFIQSFPGIDKVVLSGELELFYGNDIYEKLKKGYHNRLSGDILFTLLPGWAEYSHTGSTHGSGYEYDTHVPILMMGWGVKMGSAYEPVGPEDIAPTLTSILKITWPQAATGKPILSLFR